LLTGRSNRFEALERNHQRQFGGISFGVGGLGIPILGSGGASIPGGFAGAPGVGGGGIGPVLTLEGEFGVGFTAQDIADQIRAAEQDGELSGGQVIEIATGPSLRLVLNLALGLFELFNASGQKVGGGVTPEAAIAAANAGAAPAAGGGGAAPEPLTFPEPLTAVTTAPFVAPPTPPQADPPLFGAIQALISILRPFRTFEEIVFGPPRRTPAPSDFPINFPSAVQPFPDVFGFPPEFDPDFERIGPGIEQIRPQQIEQVLPGGTVNVPVVLGSTGDPTGVRRPTFPNQDQLSRAQQIGRLIRDFIALRKARQNADKQRRAFEQFLTARLAQLGGQQMPFGQAGFAAGALIPSVGSFLGNVGADILAGLISPGQPQAVPSLPAFPMAPTQGPLMGGGGGACPPLFRGGAPAGFRMSPVPWFPVQAPNGKWFFFGHLGTPTFSKLKGRRRHHHHSRKR